MGSPGQGISRDTETVEDSNSDDVNIEDNEAPISWAGEYHKTPQVLDQLDRYPESCKQGPVHFAQFRLKDDTEVSKLNLFMAQTEPMAAPQIMIKNYKEEFDSNLGFYVILVSYQRIYYKHRDLSRDE